MIKKIFEGNFDEEVHSNFLKFGKGEYKNRYIIEAKKQKDKWAIKTSYEFANFFVKKCLQNVNGSIDIKGIIISTFDLSDSGIEIKKVSNFQGVRKTEIEEKGVEKILSIIEKHPRCFFALSFSTNECELKIKPKAPKSGKPSSKDGEPKADFCSLKTSNPEFVKELFFDISDFKEAKAEHTIRINEIIYPKDILGMNPEEVRERSKRKGIIIRETEVDGVKKVGEADFEA